MVKFIEQTGEKFSLEKYFAARHLCQQVVARIANQACVGMNEADGQSLIKTEFQKEGITKFWHPSKFRVNSETLKTFRELPDQNIRLAEGDLFFIDVGPIYEDHEADFGQTFILQPNQDNPYQDLAQVAQDVWQKTARQWSENSLTGEQLYTFAANEAQMRGCQLNPLMAGHRLGDFPHALFSKDKLSGLTFSPLTHLWVLEIHVTHENLQRGAFFEDILTKKS